MKSIKVKCIMCGKEESVNKLHKDYKKISEKPDAAYVCEFCSMKVAGQATKGNTLLGNK